jgi:hypothetical protein
MQKMPEGTDQSRPSADGIFPLPTNHVPRLTEYSPSWPITSLGWRNIPPHFLTTGGGGHAGMQKMPEGTDQSRPSADGIFPLPTNHVPRLTEYSPSWPITSLGCRNVSPPDQSRPSADGIFPLPTNHVPRLTEYSLSRPIMSLGWRNIPLWTERREAGYAGPRLQIENRWMGATRGASSTAAGDATPRLRRTRTRGELY